jgi:phosphopantetheinyl transferase
MAARVFPDLERSFVLTRLGPAEPVLYAAVEAGEGAREAVAGRLLKALAGLAPEWNEAWNWGALALKAGPLGQPLLKLGGRTGPGISFSEAGGLLWAALTGRGQVGVDAALGRDFLPPYPYSRAFAPEEWDWAWRHCQGRTAAAAALLWAAKEAAAKSLGVGFHTLDPKTLTVTILGPAWEGLSLVVRAPKAAVSVWARPLEDGWLALAAI